MAPWESEKFKNKPIVCTLFTHCTFQFFTGNRALIMKKSGPAEGSESRVEIQKFTSLMKPK